MMTFEQFVATRERCDDLGRFPGVQDLCLEGSRGLIYCGCLWIEDATGWGADAPGHGKGRWYTAIGREEYQSDNLEEIEREIYGFAVSEGIQVPPATEPGSTPREEMEGLADRIGGEAMLVRGRWWVVCTQLDGKVIAVRDGELDVSWYDNLDAFEQDRPAIFEA